MVPPRSIVVLQTSRTASSDFPLNNIMSFGFFHSSLFLIPSSSLGAIYNGLFILVEYHHESLYLLYNIILIQYLQIVKYYLIVCCDCSFFVFLPDAFYYRYHLICPDCPYNFSPSRHSNSQSATVYLISLNNSTTFPLLSK